MMRENTSNCRVFFSENQGCLNTVTDGTIGIKALITGWRRICLSCSPPEWVCICAVCVSACVCRCNCLSSSMTHKVKVQYYTHIPSQTHTCSGKHPTTNVHTHPCTHTPKTRKSSLDHQTKCWMSQLSYQASLWWFFFSFFMFIEWFWIVVWWCDGFVHEMACCFLV